MTKAKLKGVEGGAESVPAYTLRPPDLEDIANISGAALKGADGDPQLVARLLSGKVETSEFATVLIRAMTDAGAREDMFFVLGDLWQHEPANVDEPPERWDYEPNPDLVDKGKAISREEMWRSITRYNRKRVIKRYEVAKLPPKALKSMWESLRGQVDLSDFLPTPPEPEEENSGESTTESNAVTDGPTNE